MLVTCSLGCDATCAARRSGSSAASIHHGQCLAAIRGEVVPDSLESATARCSVILGVRCHYTFATSPAVERLCSGPELRIAEIACARNARLIMGNVVPDRNPALLYLEPGLRA